MKENFEFIGRNYSEDEKTELTQALGDWSNESLEALEGELEKSEDELKMIQSLNSMVKEELDSLGISKHNSLPQERVHILDDKGFKTSFPESENKAFFSSNNDAIYLNKEVIDTKARMVSALLHEIIHRTSTRKFYADESGDIYDARVGYRINSNWKNPNRRERFRGFNEIMTDVTTYKILLKNKEVLKHDFEIDPEELKGPIFSYMNLAPILNSIIQKVAIDNKKTHQEIFDIFEKGQFESNILNLKVIEKSFGAGSLDIISLLGTLSNEQENGILEEMIGDYFSEVNEIKRKELGLKVLEFVSRSKE